VNIGANPTSAIPGVVSTYPNHLVTAIKCTPWPQLLALLGKEGERVMIDLILDCGIFQSVESGRGNYFQLSGRFLTLEVSMLTLMLTAIGIPLGDLELNPAVCTSVPMTDAARRHKSVTVPSASLPGSIVFVRNRILYARPALNKKGRVRFGLRHIRTVS
jgi:telomerase reverse transcriptase